MCYWPTVRLLATFLVKCLKLESTMWRVHEFRSIIGGGWCYYQGLPCFAGLTPLTLGMPCHYRYQYHVLYPIARFQLWTVSLERVHTPVKPDRHGQGMRVPKGLPWSQHRRRRKSSIRIQSSDCGGGVFIKTAWLRSLQSWKLRRLPCSKSVQALGDWQFTASPVFGEPTSWYPCIRFEMVAGLS